MSQLSVELSRADTDAAQSPFSQDLEALLLRYTVLMETQIRRTICDKCAQELTQEPDCPPIDTSLLHSNSVPSDWERISQSIALEKDEICLSHCNEEIRKLSELLRSLEEERSSLGRRMFERRAAISPVRRVPAEVWSNIFSLVCFTKRNGHGFSEYSVDLDTTTEENSVRSSSKSEDHVLESLHYIPPLYLSAVCLHWRDMVQGMPYLWSCISVVGEFAVDIMPLLKHCLRRSQTQPLSIQLCAGVWNLPRNETAHECIALVAEHAHRIQRLRVGGTYFPRVLQLLNVALPLPALESFQTSDHYSRLGPKSLMWQGLLHAPLLHDVSLYENPWRAVRTDRLCLPYHQLTSLVLMGYGNDEDITRVVLQILPLCTRLASLKTPFLAYTFILRNYTTPLPQSQGVTALPLLRCLKITVSWAPIDINTFFTHFDFPNLSALEIEFTGSLSPQFAQEGSDGTFSLSSRPPAFQKALSSLTSLSLRCHMTLNDGWPVIPILRATPALQSFELSIPGLNADGTPSDVLANCLDTLTISQDKKTVVPALSSLVVWDACLTICDLNAVACEEVMARLVQMARSRVDHANLRHFRLEYSNDEFTPEDWAGSAKAGNHESNSASDVCWCNCAGEEGRIPSPWRGIRGQLQPLRDSGLQVEVKYRARSF